MSQATIGLWPCLSPIFSAMRADHCDVDQAVGGIGRRFDEDGGDAALAHRLLGGGADGRFVNAIGKADGMDAEIEEGLGEQRLGAAVKRLRMQDRIARPHEGKQRGGDCRHAGGEECARFCAFIDGKAILDDLAVRMIEAGIDEPGADACRRFAPTRDEIEEVAAFLGGVEYEGRSQEYRWLDRAFRKLGVVTIVQHQRFGMQFVVADMGLRRMRRGHGFSPWARADSTICQFISNDWTDPCYL
ncbi:hypothetical protein AB7M37_001176 [Sinorhizobium fredii]